MADFYQIQTLRTEVTRLRQEQLAATDSATYPGWTREERADHEKRADRIEDILCELEILDPPFSYSYFRVKGLDSRKN